MKLWLQCAYTAGVAKEPMSGHNVRIPDTLWADAQAIAEKRYETLSNVIRQALVDYVEKNR